MTISMAKFSRKKKEGKKRVKWNLIMFSVLITKDLSSVGSYTYSDCEIMFFLFNSWLLSYFHCFNIFTERTSVPFFAQEDSKGEEKPE